MVGYSKLAWSGLSKFLTNSCDINLVKCSEEKYDQLFQHEHGGITYLKNVLDEMFTLSNMVISLLQKFLKQFSPDGVARVPKKDA
jgi:hypothetical protein